MTCFSYIFDFLTSAQFYLGYFLPETGGQGEADGALVPVEAEQREEELHHHRPRPQRDQVYFKLFMELFSSTS